MRTALVTGGTGGIGSAVCRTLARDGFMVAIHYHSGAAEATALAGELAQNGGLACTIGGDIADEAQVEAMFKELVAKNSRLEVVVNNAGITRDSLVLRMKTADWQRVLDVNLTGAFLVSRAAAKIMVAQRSGKIINVASVVGLTGNAGQANYAAAKAGLIGLTKSLAKELAARGITCNAVAPGFIETAMTNRLPDDVKANFLQQIPLRRAGTAEDVAAAISFLASARADYITGQVLSVDGGMHI